MHGRLHGSPNTSFFQYSIHSVYIYHIVLCNNLFQLNSKCLLSTYHQLCFFVCLLHQTTGTALDRLGIHTAQLPLGMYSQSFAIVLTLEWGTGHHAWSHAICYHAIGLLFTSQHSCPWLWLPGKHVSFCSNEGPESQHAEKGSLCYFLHIWHPTLHHLSYHTCTHTHTHTNL